MAIDDRIVAALRARPDGLTRVALQKAVRRGREPAWRFRRLLQELEGRGVIHRRGPSRTSTYHAGPAPVTGGTGPAPDGPRTHDRATAGEPAAPPFFSPAGAEVVALVSRPRAERTPRGYDRRFLDAYRPNRTFYLPAADRRALRELGVTPASHQPAGTWARHVLERLLIDLSWNSSRLEGNTYSLLDTERLFRSATAAGHDLAEAQMLLNHKRAIEYFVVDEPELALDSRIVRTLHAMLAENLLEDRLDEGRLRQRPVGIHDSVFEPLVVPQLIEELFERVLAKAAAITDPFEQAFFVLVHLPYLQPFADVNKRTSRLAANIPLVRHNLHLLSFVDVPREAYTLATLAVYELTRVEALRDVFVWAYRRSAERYRAIVQSLGQPDPLRLRFRDALRAIVRALVQEATPPAAVSARIAQLAAPHTDAAGLPALERLAHDEVAHLNDVTYARYGVRPSEYRRWVATRP